MVLVLALVFRVTIGVQFGLVTIVDAVDHPRVCRGIADHFEPWRSNPLWASEVSPRPDLIKSCVDQRWSVPIMYCLLDSNSPLELDDCVRILAREPTR